MALQNGHSSGFPSMIPGLPALPSSMPSVVQPSQIKQEEEKPEPSTTPSMPVMPQFNLSHIDQREMFEKMTENRNRSPILNGSFSPSYKKSPPRK